MQLIESLESRRLFSGVPLDPSFGAAGVAMQLIGQGNYRITATAVQSGGRLLVAGVHTLVGKSGTLPFLYRFKANGALDDRFAGTATIAALGRADVEAVLVQPTGRIVVKIGGEGTPDAVLGLTVAGKVDPTFHRIAGATFNFDNLITSAPDGKILTASANSDGIVIHRFTADGVLDTTFGTSGVARTTFGLQVFPGANSQRTLNVNSIAVNDSGQVYVGGSYFVFDQTTYRHAIVGRLTAGGIADNAFSSDGLYEFDQTNPAENLQSASRQVVVTPNGGVLTLYSNGGALTVYRFNATGDVTATPTTATYDNTQIFAEPDGGYLVKDGNFLSRYTASNRYVGTFGHVRVGNPSDFRTLSTDGTLYSTAFNTTTDRHGVVQYTLATNRRFINNGPAALLNVAEVTTAPSGSYVFTVQFRDLTGVLRSSLDNTDLTLVLPDMTTARVYFVKADTSTNGKIINATYKIAPIGGSWNPADNGLYVLQLNSNQINNVNSQFSDAATLGYFRVSIS